MEGYNPNPGDILYKDLDGNDIINSGTSTTKDPGDRKIIGNNTRRYQYGIHGSASWNGFLCHSCCKELVNEICG